MEEATEEKPENVSETKVSTVVANVKEEDIEIITKTTTTTESSGLAIVGARVLSESGKIESLVTLPLSVSLPSSNPSETSYQSTSHLSSTPSASQNIVVHSESSHVESSYMSSQPITLSEDLQITSGETTREESGSKKFVRFDEKTEFVPQGDREESYESVTQEQNSDTETQHIESPEKIRDEEVLDAGVELVEAADVPLEEEVSISSDVKEAVEYEPNLPTSKGDVDENPELVTENVEEPVANLAVESTSADETRQPEIEKEQQPQVETIQEKIVELDEHIKPSEELLEELLKEPLEEHQPISGSVKKFKASSKEEQAQIQEGSIKEQLHEIINEIDLEVSNEDEGAARRHTWKPRGVYKMEKTEIKYEDIVPIKVADVKIEDRPKKEPSKEKEQKEERKKGIKVEIDHNMENYIQGEPSPLSKLLRHCLINGEVLSPTDIPIGIPLLAKILPKEGEEDHEKISLERLFTPASDWEEIIPHKKKAYASSCFYRPDHPTIDDQVELAHKISTSLVDETNKTSKGQTMYIKRKNRSAKWIHQGEEGMLYEDSAASQYDMDEEAEEHRTKEKPPLQLVVNKKIAHDYSQIQHHYEDFLSTSQTLQQISNMEVGKEIATDLQSPTGKGAALFAKRKKRMDKFIIDETTLQQQQQQQSIVHEETKSSTTASTTTTVNNFESKFSSQDQKLVNSSRVHNEPAVAAAPTVTKTDPNQTGGLMLPDLTDILTKSKPPEKKTPSLAERGISKKKPAPRSHSADSSKTTSGFQNKQFSQSQPKQKKEMLSKQTIHNGPVGQLYNASSFAGHKLESLEEQFTSQVNYQNPLESLRPGSPPTYMIPNGVESFVEHKIDHSTSQSINDLSSSMAATNNESGAIYTAEVKVIQNSSPISTSSIINYSAPAPQHSILSDLTSVQEKDKRKSFNLAPKGWGTYNTYYTPVHLGAP